MANFCPKCGAQTRPNARFCGACGHDVSQVASPAVQNPQPASLPPQSYQPPAPIYPPAPPAPPASAWPDPYPAGQPPPLVQDQWQASPGGKTLQERKAMLAQHLQQEVARGGRVESQSDFMAVVVYGKPLNHVLHLLISVFTAGLWIPIWIILALSGGEKRKMISVDEFGNVQVQRA